MASGAVPGPAESQVTVLKVSINCERCRQKVFKILRKIKGVELVEVDARQNKVTVKAPVDAQTLIRKYKKSGKHAELWPVQNIIPTEHIAYAKNETEGPSKSEEQQEKPQNPAMAAHPVFEPQPALIMCYNMVQPSVMQTHYVSPAMPVSQVVYMYVDQYAPRPPQYECQYAPSAPPLPGNYYSKEVDGHSEASDNHHPAADPYSNTLFRDDNSNCWNVM